VADGIKPRREEIWQRFAEEIGARYVPGDFWQSEQIIARMDPWTVTLETHHDPAARVPCTRLTAPYISADRFTFSIFRASAFQDVGLLSSADEIIVGDAVFDTAFRVAGSDAERVRALLENPHLRHYLLGEPQIGLEAGIRADALPRLHSPQAQLICIVLGIVEERDRLLHLFELMGETLQHLRAIGSAANRDPASTT
jgi:hypothetical protein